MRSRMKKERADSLVVFSPHLILAKGEWLVVIMAWNLALD